MNTQHKINLTLKHLFIFILSASLILIVSCGKEKKKKKISEKEYYISHTPKQTSKKQKQTKNNSKKQKTKNKKDSDNNQNSKPIVLTDLFQTQKARLKNKAIPAQASKPLTEKQFADIIIKETPKMNDSDFEVIKKSILQANNIDLGLLAAYLSKSDNKRINLFAYDLVTMCSISHTEYFKPNKFLKIIAQLDFNAEPYLNKIITETNDDFCREWACELYVEIFYHNADKTDSRFQKLKKNKEMIKHIYARLKDLFSDPEKVQIALKTKSLGREIRMAFGDDKRYPLKMLQVLRILDNLNKKNLFASSSRLLKVINTYNYNYNILNHLNGKPVDLPAISEKVQLKYLAQTVFSDKVNDTYNWIPRENGGFTKKETEEVFNSNDTDKILQMNQTFKKIITSVLRGKLLLGLGNRELAILRYFYYSVWHKGPLKWNDSMIIINNNTGKSVALVLSKKITPNDILTGKVSKNKDDIENRNEEFLVPAQSSFVWFAQDGKFTIAPDKKQILDDLPAIAIFETKKFTLDSLMIIDIN